MGVHVEWSNSSRNVIPKVTGQMPRKPVHWIGEIYLLMPDGEKDIRSWRSNRPITSGDAQKVLGRLLDMLIGEHGKDSAVSSGFWIKSR